MKKVVVIKKTFDLKRIVNYKGKGVFSRLHKFELLDHGEYYKWQYCSVCIRIRATLNKVGVLNYSLSDWIKDSLSNCSAIKKSEYTKEKAVALLNEQLILSYKKLNEKSNVG